MLKYDRESKRLVNIAIDDHSSPFYALRDRQGNAIGVTACDIDGDGREEIYVLNTNNAFSGMTRADTKTHGTHTFMHRERGNASFIFYKAVEAVTEVISSESSSDNSAAINRTESFRVTLATLQLCHFP